MKSKGVKKSLFSLSLIAAMTQSSAVLANEYLVCKDRQDCAPVAIMSTLVGGPTGTTLGAETMIDGRARMLLMNQAAPYAADFIAGGSKNDILDAAMNALREERRQAGEMSEASELSLAKQIIAEAKAE